MMGETLVELRQVSVGYGRKPLGQNLSLCLKRGDYMGLVGPNGTGKTTLLRCLIGELKPLAGEVIYAAGLHPGESRPRFGYMPQQQNAEQHFPVAVRDVVLMGRYPLMGRRIRANAEDWQAVDECLRRVGLEHLAHHYFYDLSGGQKQRVLLARALARDPDVLLLDEPTNGLDIVSLEDTQAIIDALHEEGLTVLMVSHQLEVVARHATTVGLLLRDEQGMRLRVGPTSEVVSSQSLSDLYKRKVRYDEVNQRIYVER